MTDSRLPLVEEGTIRDLTEAIADEGNQSIVMTWMEAMDKENPLLSDQIRQWVKLMQPAFRGETFYLLMGPALVYQLLEAQTHRDTTKV